jgi:hypothetical protein
VTCPPINHFLFGPGGNEISIPGARRNARIKVRNVDAILYTKREVMKTIRYKFQIDPDVEINKHEDIAFLVASYLNSPDGWGYFFEAVDSREQVLIRLSTPKTIFEKCGLSGNLSCAELGGKYVYLNSDRWFYGAPKSKLALDDYRQYMVLHEIGHILGHDHKKCPCKNCPAPIMMQQTKGIGECRPNNYVR